jgi:hypothetical protein
MTAIGRKSGMKIDALARQVLCQETDWTFAQAEATHESFDFALQVTRSQQNIAEWKTYLPDACIATMIALGWDRTT